MRTANYYEEATLRQALRQVDQSEYCYQASLIQQLPKYKQSEVQKEREAIRKEYLNPGFKSW